MTRTWNPLIRGQMPYPLGHKATNLGHKATKRKTIMPVNIWYKVYLGMRQNITTFPRLEPGIH